jgi:predicted SnoaL-like aldol condensation-catalyzing enzyme
MQEPSLQATKQLETKRKEIVKEVMQLIVEQKFTEILRFFFPDCKTHNPYIPGNMETLLKEMQAANNEGKNAYPQAQFSVKHILVDGNLVAAHTELLNDKTKPARGGLRQVHLFRFERDKIIEYWDITQQILPNMPNAASAF